MIVKYQLRDPDIDVLKFKNTSLNEIQNFIGEGSIVHRSIYEGEEYYRIAIKEDGHTIGAAHLKEGNSLIKFPDGSFEELSDYQLEKLYKVI